MTAYRKKSIIIGQNVNIFKCGRLCGEGTVEDIDDLCRIKVRYENGNTETLSSGEISIKKQNT